MSNKQKDDLNQVMENLSVLHHQFHQDDIPPQNEEEAQTEILLDGVKRIVSGLIYDERGISIIEMSLFYFFHHLFVRSVDLEEKAGDLPIDATISEAVRLMSLLPASIKDEGPNEQMATVGEMVTQLKDAVNELEEKPKSQQEIRENAEKTNSAIYEFINLVVGHGVHPMLVQNVLHYYRYMKKNKCRVF